MEALLYTWLALATLLSMATGQTITPASWANSIQESNGEIGMFVSHGDNEVPLGAVLPLTDTAKHIPVRYQITAFRIDLMLIYFPVLRVRYQWASLPPRPFQRIEALRAQCSPHHLR